MKIFIPGPSLAAEKQGLGLKFSIENEIFKPRMKISSENENFVRGGMGFFMRSIQNEIFRSQGPLGEVYDLWAVRGFDARARPLRRGWRGGFEAGVRGACA